MNFVDSVKNIISDSDHVFFNWVHREASQVAHVLTDWSLNQSLLVFFFFFFNFIFFFLFGIWPPSYDNVILAEAFQIVVSGVV